MWHAVFDRIQPVPERFVSNTDGLRLVERVVPLLLLRFATQLEPVDLG